MTKRSYIIHRLCHLSFWTAVALLLGYIESFIPFYPGIAGMKLGLPNLVIVVLLSYASWKDALYVNLLRILLNGFLFGNGYSILFSLSGGLLSLLIMSLFHHWQFHIYNVSIVGGICHNLGQIFIAIALTSTPQLLYYFPFLIICGSLCGLCNGAIAKTLLAHLPNQITRH